MFASAITPEPYVFVSMEQFRVRADIAGKDGARFELDQAKAFYAELGAAIAAIEGKVPDSGLDVGLINEGAVVLIRAHVSATDHGARDGSQLEVLVPSYRGQADEKFWVADSVVVGLAK